ncbi:hypothetical protein PG990_007146 [Apiospora arundinis]
MEALRHWLEWYILVASSHFVYAVLNGAGLWLLIGASGGPELNFRQEGKWRALSESSNPEGEQKQKKAEPRKERTRSELKLRDLLEA